LTDSKFGTKQPMNALAEDSRLIIVAGSDTTAATLTCAFYHLAKNPAVYKKLQRCVDTVFPGGDKEFNYTTAASSLPFLEGVINETMRLTPAVPAGLMRTTPLEGIHFALTPLLRILN
jgi:cytochrome P450